MQHHHKSLPNASSSSNLPVCLAAPCMCMHVHLHLRNVHLVRCMHLVHLNVHCHALEVCLITTHLCAPETVCSLQMHGCPEIATGMRTSFRQASSLRSLMTYRLVYQPHILQREIGNVYSRSSSGKHSEQHDKGVRWTRNPLYARDECLYVPYHWYAPVRKHVRTRAHAMRERE